MLKKSNLISRKETAKRLGVSVVTVDRMRKVGEITKVDLPGGRVGIREAEIDAMTASDEESMRFKGRLFRHCVAAGENPASVRRAMGVLIAADEEKTET